MNALIAGLIFITGVVALAIGWRIDAADLFGAGALFAVLGGADCLAYMRGANPDQGYGGGIEG